MADQFHFKPVIQNDADYTSQSDSFVIGGMGGSHLAAGLMKIYSPNTDIYIHRDYGLPSLAEKRFKNSLFIASSYSGNTEETIDFAHHVLKKKLRLAIVTTGGVLGEFAQKNNIPFIQLPNEHIQPRAAVGVSFVALARLVLGEAEIARLNAFADAFNPLAFETEGKQLADALKNRIPIVYSSRANGAIAYNWKIKFNETTKIPAFANVFPELNHNEMTGFDVLTSTKDLSSRFHFIFLSDSGDHPKIIKRMEILKKMYEDRGLPVTVIDLVGSPLGKIFHSLVLADWTALFLSKIYGTEPEQVHMVEEFKKLIA